MQRDRKQYQCESILGEDLMALRVKFWLPANPSRPCALNNILTRLLTKEAKFFPSNANFSWSAVPS